MNPYLKLSNYHPRNIKHFIQGHIRKRILMWYAWYFKNNHPVDKMIKYQNCMGNCQNCGCPLIELILSDKDCDKCQTLH